MSQCLPLPEHLNKGSDSDILRFVVLRAIVYAFNSKDLKTLADKSGVRADSLTRFIANGAFTPRAANRIEKAVGRDFIRWEWLVNPVISFKNGDII